jgi:hypothetical protein
MFYKSYKLIKNINVYINVNAEHCGIGDFSTRYIKVND